MHFLEYCNETFILCKKVRKLVEDCPPSTPKEIVEVVLLSPKFT